MRPHAGETALIRNGWKQCTYQEWADVVLLKKSLGYKAVMTGRTPKNLISKNRRYWRQELGK